MTSKYCSDEESDEEDETAELMRELEKIKKERAEEKERLEREQNASAAVAREAEIATSNPLLNLAAALGQSPGISTTVPGTFSVKRRWDDGKPPGLSCSSFAYITLSDLIFKNQAANQKDKSGHFVNDLLRTEFHKYVTCVPLPYGALTSFNTENSWPSSSNNMVANYF